MLIQTGLIVAWKLLLQSRHVLADGIQDAPLAIHPTFLALAEQPVEEPMGDHLRRKGPLVSGPAHVALHAFAKRFLRDANLQRAESRVAAELGCDHLVDRWSARSPSGEPGSSHQPAHGIGMTVALSSGRRVVQTTDHVNVGPERRERRKAWRDAKVGPLLGWDPVPLR